MPAFGPISRTNLIRCFKQLGFAGPYSGGRHEYMSKGELRVFIPNPHTGDISKGLLAKILKQAGIDRKEWESL